MKLRVLAAHLHSMKSSRRGCGHRFAFLCLGTMAGAGTSYASGVAVGSALAVDVALLAIFEAGGATLQSVASFPFALLFGLLGVLVIAFVACIPGAIAGFFVALAFPFCARRELSATIGAAVGAAFVWHFRSEIDVGNSWFMELVLSALAGAGAGLMQNLVLHRLESDQ